MATGHLQLDLHTDDGSHHAIDKIGITVRPLGIPKGGPRSKGASGMTDSGVKRARIAASSYFLVGPHGLEPWTKGFWFVQLSLLPGLCLHRNSVSCLRWVPSSLYTFNDTFASELGSALPYALLHVGFTDFDTIPYAVSKRMAQLAL